MLVAITYFHYLLFCFQFFRVRFENAAKFTEKLFLRGKLLVELAEVVVAAILILVVILKKMESFFQNTQRTNIEFETTKNKIISTSFRSLLLLQQENLIDWTSKNSKKGVMF